MTDFSIIIPAKDEAQGLSILLPKIRAMYPSIELIVVDDGSHDETRAVGLEYGAIVISHPQSLGNGAAIKTGARAASSQTLLFMDADGQHQPQDIPRLLQKLAQGFDMAVGARDNGSQAGVHRSIANRIYNSLASWMVGHRVYDLTSGFRAVRAEKFRRFIYLLPNGFSYPTTITMSFFRAGYPVAYESIYAPRRIGKSHLRIAHDGMRFLLIIFKVGTLYSPLKTFVPISAAFFLLGLSYYFYTFVTLHRLTNMSALLFVTSVLIFLIGLVSEQITALMYRETDVS